MSRPLQDLNDSRYERPNETWDERESGGITKRERSLRSKRAIFTFTLTAFIVGATLILFNSPYRNEFLAPGPLSSSHAQILAGQGADRCAACHGAGNSSFASWFSDAISSGKELAACQSDLCMECHQNSLNGQYAMVAHNVDPTLLAEKSKQGGNSPFMQAAFSSLVSAPVNGIGEIACSACHREHHGTESLSALTDAQCQTCHSDQFHSFETDHPEFTSWPSGRRSRIAFDHASHGLKHFAAKGVTWDCAQCHIDDNNYDAKLLAPFEQSCAQCHENQINESSETTLPLLALPMLDLDAVTEAGGNVGEWPEPATGDFDGPLPGIMRILLSADTKAAPLLEKYGPDFEFGDIDPFDSAQVRDACELVWAIKRLIHDLAKDGSESVQHRLEIVLERSVTPGEMNQLLAGLDAPVFRQAADRWLPNLATEMQSQLAYGKVNQVAPHSLAGLADGKIFFRYRPRLDDELAANPLKGLMKPGAQQQAVAMQPQANSTQSQQNTAQQAFPQQQVPNSNSTAPTNTGAAISSSRPAVNMDESGADFLASNPLKGQVQPSAGSFVQPGNSGTAGTMNAGGSYPANSSGQQSSGGMPNQTANGIPGKNVNLDESGADFLAANPLKKMLAGQAPNMTAQVPDIGQNPGGNVNQAPIANGNGPAAASPPAVPPVAPIANFPQTADPNGVPVASRAGWVRNDVTFQIGYKPGGHADMTLSRWTKLVVETDHADTRHETASLFKKLTNVNGIGMCRSCHTVDQSGDRFLVNWKGEAHKTALRSFTKFSHGAHLVQPHLQDCSYCHTLDEESGTAHLFAGFDAAVSATNFKPIVKANCASCHSEGQTDDSCTKCHNYHVGSKITSGE